MSELPAGWVEATIGEICAIGPKSTWDDDMEVGFVPMSHAPTNFRDPMNYEPRPWHEVKKAYTHFENGDVIFAKVTPCFENGKAALVSGLPGGAGAGSSEFHVLRRRDAGISPSYLLAVIKSAQFLREGEENMTGAVGLRRVPRAFVESFPVRLPPEAEQKRIAQKLDALLAQVDTLKARIDAIPALLKRFRQSVLADASSGRLTSGWRARHEVTSPQLTWIRAKIKRHAFKIPEQWLGVSLGSVCERVSVGHVGKTSEYYVNADSGVPFLRSQNVRPGRISLDGLAYITNDFNSKLKKSQLQEGDLLVVRVGANRGDACIVPKMKGPLNCANIVFARPCKGLPPFLNVYFQSPKARSLLLGETVGGAQGVINTKAVSEIFLALPPKEEQIEIVRRVEQLFAFADQLEAKVAIAKQRIDTLTQSILAKAFRGELVPQDPNDEPASVLLERIRAQRAATPKIKRGRKPVSST